MGKREHGKWLMEEWMDGDWKEKGRWEVAN